MNSHSIRSITITISILVILSVITSSCQIFSPAVSATYVQGIYYRETQDPVTQGKITFGFIQLFDQGVFTFVDITYDTPSSRTVLDTYEQTAKAWLIPNGMPYHTGNYVIIKNRITLNYPAMGENGAFPATQRTGTISEAKLELKATGDDTAVQYLRYPPGNDAPLLNATPPSSPENTRITCLLGTWRVDPDSYVIWMNAVENKDPNIIFTKVDPAFHYRFNEDGSLAIYLDANNTMTFISNDPTGGNAEISMELDYSSGALKGTFTELKTDPDFPDLMLMKMEITENPITVIGMKVNGQSIPQVETMNVVPMIDTTFFNKIGYVCGDDSLQLIPLGTGLPLEGYLLYRESNWQPSAP